MKETLNVSVCFRARKFAVGERIVRVARQERARQEERHQGATGQVMKLCMVNGHWGHLFFSLVILWLMIELFRMR